MVVIFDMFLDVLPPFGFKKNVCGVQIGHLKSRLVKYSSHSTPEKLVANIEL